MRCARRRRLGYTKPLQASPMVTSACLAILATFPVRAVDRVPSGNCVHDPLPLLQRQPHIAMDLGEDSTQDAEDGAPAS